MATSSITANFRTEDPKAANAIVHALFAQAKPTVLQWQGSFREAAHSDLRDRRFFSGLSDRIRELRAGTR